MNPWSNLIAGRFVKQQPSAPAFMADRHGARSVDPIDWRINRALEDKYGETSDVGMANAMLEDMGLGDYNVGYKPEANFSPRNVGAYRYGPNYVAIGQQMPEARRATLAHEVLHAGERIVGRDSQSSDHFGSIPGNADQADQSFARALEAQNAINQGYDADPEDLRAMPWLHHTAPSSSQGFVSPWSRLMKKPIPSDVWNGIYPGEKF